MTPVAGGRDSDLHGGDERQCGGGAGAELCQVVEYVVEAELPAVAVEEILHKRQGALVVVEFAEDVAGSFLFGDEGLEGFDLHTFDVDFYEDSLCRGGADGILDGDYRHVD